MKKTPTEVRIGAHQSIAGGLSKSVDRAVGIGARCLQIFSGAPQRWESVVHSESEIRDFKTALEKSGISPVFVHAKYLINLGTDDAFLMAKSISAMIEDLRFASSVGAQGVIVHFGSHPTGWLGPKRGMFIPLVRQILSETPSDVSFLFENSAGGGSSIGVTLTELEAIGKDLPESRVGFFLDTAHAFAAGYDLRTAETVNAFVAEVGYRIGWERVAGFHANDAKVDLGSRRDRHDNIGEGKIGLEGFKVLLNHPAVLGKPFILETPGKDHSGPDAENIKRLTNCVDMT